MEWIDFAIINAGISAFFALWSVSQRLPPFSAIPNGVLAIIFYVLAQAT